MNSWHWFQSLTQKMHGHLIIVYSLVRGNFLLLAILVHPACYHLWNLITINSSVTTHHLSRYCKNGTRSWQTRSRVSTCWWIARFFCTFKTCKTSLRYVLQACFSFDYKKYRCGASYRLILSSLQGPLAFSTHPQGRSKFWLKTYCAATFKVGKITHRSSLKDRNLHKQQSWQFGALVRVNCL